MIDIAWQEVGELTRGYAYVEGYGCVQSGYAACTHPYPENHTNHNDEIHLIVRNESLPLGALVLCVRTPYVNRVKDHQLRPGELILGEGSFVTLHTGFKTKGRRDDEEKGEPCEYVDGTCFDNDRYSGLHAQELWGRYKLWPDLRELREGFLTSTEPTAISFWRDMEALFAAWMDVSLTEAAKLPRTCPHCGGSGSVE